MSKLLTDRRRILPVLVVALIIAVGATLVIVLAGGSTGGPISTPAPSTTASGGKSKMITVHISMFAFHPSTVTIAAGTRIAFINTDTTEHTATAADGAAFDTGAIQQGQMKTVMLTKPGTYAYKCAFHPFMTGTVIVK